MDIALGFKNLTVGSDSNVLSDVSGYVRRGCITAVLGASAAGKSVLLQTLSGRIQDLGISGDVYMDGREVLTTTLLLGVDSCLLLVVHD